MKKSPALQLFFSIMFCQLAGIIGSFFTFSSVKTWFITLNKPFFQPPSWLFSPVWITLYTLMGVALFLIWTKKKQSKKHHEAISIFILQLAINALWSIVFFGWHNLLLSIFVIGFLWALIVILIGRFYKIDKRAAYLLIPYLLWVSFATILNFAVWALN